MNEPQAIQPIKQPKTVKQWLNGDTFRQQVALCLPKHLTADRFVRVAITAITRIPKLAQCTPESVMECLMTLSALGLEPDGRRAHLIPYGNTCQLVIDYKGLVELAKRNGDVSNIYAQAICDNDDFTYDTGEIKHLVDFRKPRGEPYAYYCIIRFKDGGTHTEVMTKDEVDRIRNRSKAAKSGPWVTDYEEMAKKTVFRRASKWVTLSPEIQDALDKEADPVKVPLISVIEDLPASPEPATAETPIEVTAEKTGLSTVNDTLAEIVTGDAKLSFDQFSKWAIAEGHLKEGEADSFAAVPVDVARRLTRAKTGMLAQMAKMFGAV